MQDKAPPDAPSEARAAALRLPNSFNSVLEKNPALRHTPAATTGSNCMYQPPHFREDRLDVQHALVKRIRSAS
jgi:hypothetical protein